MVEVNNPGQVQDSSSPRAEERSIDPRGYIQINLRTSNRISVHGSILPVNKNGLLAENHTHPKEVPDWSNLGVIHKNALPPRASFFIYDNYTDALTRDPLRSKTLSLSGTWKFSLFKSPFDAPPFYEPDFDARAWGSIEVPGMWQLQGFGKGPQ
jgi:beta-galactosidase